MDLRELGWNQDFEEHFAQYLKEGFYPARVAFAQREIYTLFTEDGEHQGALSGKLRHHAEVKAELPVVGDWVAAKKPQGEGTLVIHSILPRRNSFSRKVTGDAVFEEQVLAANIDYAFIVSALDDEFNLRRIERYLVLAWNSGSNPVIILNKVDLSDQVKEQISEVENVAAGVPIHAISAKYEKNLKGLDKYFVKGKTTVFLGSSGVGKSTIINAILGEERLRTEEVRGDDSKGRHTTTYREMLILPQGGLVIDNPGMRELQLWADSESLSGIFSDIEILAENCRFSDCAHESEPGCAVKAAVENGKLTEGRLINYQKLREELKYLDLKKNQKQSLIERAKWKSISKEIKRIKKRKSGK